MLGATAIYNMNRGQKYHVRVLADSRGRNLKNELHRLNDNSFYFSTRVRKGARLTDLWEMAENDILSGQIDLLLLYGGICDVTDIYFSRRGSRSYWPPADLSSRFESIKSIMHSITNNYRLMNCNTKLCFIPEAGVGLARINHIASPIPEDIRSIQLNLENELVDLRNFTKRMNDSLDIITPWTIKVTHLRRENKWVPVYSRSHDGLHPSFAQAFKMAKIIKNFVRNVFEVHEDHIPVS